MKIRRYMGKDMQEAFLKLKMDLGNDAVILNTRRVKKKGIAKMFSKPVVEVLAAVDDDYKKSKETKESTAAVKETVHSKNEDDGMKKMVQLEKKVENMGSVLQKIHEQLKNGSTEDDMKPGKEEYLQNPKVLDVFLKNMLENDVDPQIADDVIEAVKTKCTDSENVDKIAKTLYSEINEILGVSEIIKLNEKGKPVTAIFVGPTGVGKTTTIAKLAADYSLNHGKNVGLITVDTYRIAAIEQLKTYAEILNIPLTVVYTPSEIEEAVSIYQDKDLILIDTAGRSHSDKAQFEELKDFVSSSKADEIFLLLSATTNMKVCGEIFKNYKFLKDYKLIITKVDESPMPGIILNAVKMTGNKLSYVTTGQSVPDDIEKADIDYIIKNLLGRMLNDGSGGKIEKNNK